MLRSFASVLLLVVLGTTACSKDPNKEQRPGGPPLGEPIGAELDANGTVPALLLALAVSKGQDPDPVLPKVVGAVSSAIGKCPAFVTEEKDSITAVTFTVADGKLKIAPRPDASPAVACLLAALEGKDIGAPAALDGRVEIKLRPAAKTP